LCVGSLGLAEWRELAPFLERLREAVVGLTFHQSHPLVLRELHQLGVLRTAVSADGSFDPSLYVFRGPEAFHAVVGACDRSGASLDHRQGTAVWTSCGAEDPFALRLENFLEECAARGRLLTPAELDQYEEDFLGHEALADAHGRLRLAPTAPAGAPATTTRLPAAAEFLAGDLTEHRRRYEEIFGLEEPTEDAAETTESDQDREVATEGEEEGGLDAAVDRILRGWGFGQHIRERIQETWGQLSGLDRTVAFHHLACLGSDDVSLTYQLEGLFTFFGTWVATHAFHALYPWAVFPVDVTQRYPRLRLALCRLGISYDTQDLLPAQVARNLGDAVDEYRVRNELEHWQVWALVYHLVQSAPEAETDELTLTPLVWCVAAGPDNFATVEGHAPASRDTWSVPERARRGDLLLMYCLMPRSEVVAAYRCDTDAYPDPFEQYYGGVWAEITGKVGFAPITLAEMRKDPVLKEWSLVRMNFRGMMKTPVPEQMWQRLRELIAARDPEAARRLSLGCPISSK
jgi:hypothetical protein